jgi:hypothetical protein
MDVRRLCVLSRRCPCDELITRPEESYRLWRVVVCDHQTSWYKEAIARAGLQSQRNRQPSIVNKRNICSEETLLRHYLRLSSWPCQSPGYFFVVKVNTVFMQQIKLSLSGTPKSLGCDRSQGYDWPNHKHRTEDIDNVQHSETGLNIESDPVSETSSWTKISNKINYNMIINVQ